MIHRRKTRVVRVGKIGIGGGHPVSVQSMAKVKTADIARVLKQIRSLEHAGCEIIRVAVKDMSDARAIRRIKNSIFIPLVADIHFDYRLALCAIESGADKIRLNPGNIPYERHVDEVVKHAKKRKVPIRIGVNSGSVKPGKSKKTGPGLLVSAAMGYIKMFERRGFRDIIISLKSSDVDETVAAYRKLAGMCDYPLHLGVTAAGPNEAGIVKSAIGIGALLLDGIGDTIRVSLTGDPCREVSAGRMILKSLGLRDFGPVIVACPTCGRCQVDIADIVDRLGRVVNGAPGRFKPLKIAVMGCEVNGPGEARGADVGIAFGRGSGVLFKKGKIIRKINARDAVKIIIKEIS
ncbi:MAG: flavodoxin-dependent (E)-4-hydroxy-3-methylbut-2-enyl-diphosphate synthase [Candidatus Omnitrophota bacterium]